MIKWDRASLKAFDHKMLDALEQTAEVIRDDVREAKVVPRDTGNLQNEAFGIDASSKARGVIRLTFNTPYARRLYFHPEYHFNKDKNPGAKGEWMKDWMKGGIHERRAAEVFAKILRRH